MGESTVSTSGGEGKAKKTDAVSAAGEAGAGGDGKRSAAVKASKTKASDSQATFEPRIVVFACNWCSYAGADTAGVSRLQYSPKFRLIRTMCSGRVNTVHVLKSFQLGADGVLVSGCHIGDCHYLFGNEWAIKQFEVTKKLLHRLGLEDGRVRLEWVSAAEGPRWAALIDEFVAQIQALGPSPLRAGVSEETFQAEPVGAEVRD